MKSAICHPSIARRLARMMTLFMLVGLGLLSATKYAVTRMDMQAEQQNQLREKARVMADLIGAACTQGEPELLRKLALFEPVRGSTRLYLQRGDGSALFSDASPAFSHKVSMDFTVPADKILGGQVLAHVEMDTTHDHRTLKNMAVTMLLTTLLGAVACGLVIRWLVRRELSPLVSLAAQTRAMSPRRLDQRLALARPAEELVPWVDQFNALMERLQRAYVQLEAFNADVAHELRTPLATLIGQTEVTLSRERDNDTLRETLASNLEDMQRLSVLINDMLFLSQADSGAQARRGQPVSLAEVAREVAEFHEGALEEAGLTLAVEGDARVAVDEPLIKRALSNLLGNASRYAEAGSQVRVRIEADPEPLVGGERAIRLMVENRGPAIAPEHLSRLFDRFFRADPARCHSEAGLGHGLGLAIVAAIARMHAGRTLASSGDGLTRVGLTVAV